MSEKFEGPFTVAVTPDGRLVVYCSETIVAGVPGRRSESLAHIVLARQGHCCAAPEPVQGEAATQLEELEPKPVEWDRPASVDELTKMVVALEHCVDATTDSLRETLDELDAKVTDCRDDLDTLSRWVARVEGHIGDTTRDGKLSADRLDGHYERISKLEAWRAAITGASQD